MTLSQIQVDFLEFVLKDAADRLQILNQGKTGLVEQPESDAGKLDNDVSFTRQILLDTLEELKSKRSANILNSLFENIARAEDQEKQILQTYDTLMETSNLLDLGVSRKIEELEEVKKSLKTRREDLEHVYEGLLRAARNNEKVLIRIKDIERTEKIESKQEVAESAIAIIKKNEDSTTTDNILNEMFIDAFIETRLVQLEEQIEQWSAKYEADMEVNTTKVKDTKDEIQNLSNENAEMVVLIAKREKEMEKFLEIKAKREAEEAAEKKIIDSATSIQAWWRGVMVRRKLGPFRKKKKKKSEKSGAKVHTK